MNFVKKYWYLIIVAAITVGLGVVVFLTTQKLKEEKPVAPSVPQAQPKAVVPKCTLTLSFTVETPTPTPTGTITPTPTPTGQVTPTPTSTPGGPTSTPTPTSPPGGPTPTPTKPPTTQIPVSGSGPGVLGASTIAGGILLLLVGLLAF
ncbi:hypothetical protein HY031_00565 [Candidatus Gottesmanbacteria bacterium]|nr:hypothetical protein [Candidatus Gottesmanbacteria bacterium]